MAVDAVDVLIQSMMSKAKIEANDKASEHDAEAAARKAAEKRLANKKQAIKSSLVDRETFQRNKQVDSKLSAVLGGQFGREPADALRQFENNPSLQNRLTEAQRNQFREAMAQNPKGVAKAGQALNRLAQSETFGKAVNTSQQAGVIQDAILNNPASEPNISRMLGNRFMQSPKADPQSKSSLLRFGIKKGAGVGLDRTLDMMGSIAQHNVGRSGQRASMNMAQRQADNPSAMETVDRFVQKPVIHKMPMPAKTKATEILARANGSAEVADGLAKVAQDPKFKAQTAANKGRIFATIGTGRSSEFRQLADQNLRALQSAKFPTRSAQVSRFLGKLSNTVSKQGAAGVDVDDLIRSSKQSPMPEAPVLLSSEGLSGDDARKIRRQNLAKVIQYYNKVMRSLDKSEKQLCGAKCFEDVNQMKNLREPADIDLALLPPSDQALVRDKKSKVSDRLAALRQVHKQRSRELRRTRMPLAKRRAKAAQARAQGSQSPYFMPNVDRHAPASQAFLQAVPAHGEEGETAQRLAQTPARAQRGRTSRGHGTSNRASRNGPNIQKLVAQAMPNLDGGTLTPEIAAAVAQSVAAQVAPEIIKQVTKQVSDELAKSFGAAPSDATDEGAPTEQASRTTPSQTAGRPAKASAAPRDGWGIPRHFSPELGGKQHEVVKAPPGQSFTEPLSMETPEADAPYTGKMLVKNPTLVRPMPELMIALWKSMSRAEQALLKNLGWNQQTWDTKDTPAARWPNAMATVFASLTPLQRESLKKLGFSATDWDKRVQAFTMGKNA